MKKISLLIFVASLVIFGCKTETTHNGAATSSETPALGHTNLDVAGFKDKMSTGKYVLLDVRTAEEFEEGHIKGAINFDVNQASFSDRIVKLKEGVDYLVYCQGGKRSVNACTIMSKAGLKNLYNLEGGYKAWSKAN